MMRLESLLGTLATEIGIVFALLFGCSSAVGGALATEIFTTPGPQVAESGVLQPQSIVHAQPTAPTPAPKGDQASDRGYDQYDLWRLRKKLRSTSRNQVIEPDVSAILGAPLPEPRDNPNFPS